MPELPEVETTRKGIEPYLVDVIVDRVVIRQPMLRWPVTPELPTRLAQQVIRSVTRRGKYIAIHTDVGTMIVHLGMSGSLYLVDQKTEALFHDHVDIILGSGKCLRYTDPRRFGSILWTEEDWFAHPLIRSLGPEPLTDEFNVDYLTAQAKSRKKPIKTFIMDSKIVVGVGNIYANEALFMSGIRPDKPAGGISKKRLALLVDNIKTILSAAIKQGGTTLKDFVGGDGKPGYFKQNLSVYGRAGEPCVNCQKALIESRLGQRSTVYCPACQK
ncbi:bifunctional DNA-formamidopyrimidine glycosylase/DNA-(apurinic or apyrimidinic site) lyase [Marinomonas sp. 15G1-11]|uniref:Formamidopyrimidine-DNA glycosylase n=1 Tax=Marinomonas phaeophyticola TaxID=3004091 RepID=A0ABT4JZ35_9GAMM|nr:bifunctional DNA-formamidopyrimidine glycosylase/DNA-(apurinic or apyrimidinic site) lyase [Marinomonas sp. 15G1-11]MCZ2723657.1 bifunctional DNA-formamidopyrimidine glycosylase/DNA-(apurinic or apyrimidinic site) lyase [Marinomonas sp. 15G1-11]